MIRCTGLLRTIHEHHFRQSYKCIYGAMAKGYCIAIVSNRITYLGVSKVIGMSTPPVSRRLLAMHASYTTFNHTCTIPSGDRLCHAVGKVRNE